MEKVYQLKDQKSKSLGQNIYNIKQLNACVAETIINQKLWMSWIHEAEKIKYTSKSLN